MEIDEKPIAMLDLYVGMSVFERENALRVHIHKVFSASYPWSVSAYSHPSIFSMVSPDTSTSEDQDRDVRCENQISCFARVS